MLEPPDRMTALIFIMPYRRGLQSVHGVGVDTEIENIFSLTRPVSDPTYLTSAVKLSVLVCHVILPVGWRPQILFRKSMKTRAFRGNRRWPGKSRDRLDSCSIWQSGYICTSEPSASPASQ